LAEVALAFLRVVGSRELVAGVGLVLLGVVGSSRGLVAGVDLVLLVEVASSRGLVAGEVFVVFVGLCRI
jgi:hypothetical protein